MHQCSNHGKTRDLRNFRRQMGFINTATELGDEMVAYAKVKYEDMVVYAKVKYEDEMRRLAVEPSVSLSELRTKICQLFKLDGDAQQLEIIFRDPDDDAITMSDDSDVAYAFRDEEESPLRLEIAWSRKPTPRLRKSLGPCGGGGGTHWNDGTFEGIKAITVTADSRTVYSVQVSYATANDNLYEARRHGGDAGKTIRTVFKYPSEELQKIRGYIGTVCDRWSVIKGLIFETNHGTYGPFGAADWIPFELDLSSTKVVGFYGRASSWYLGSIGPHTVP